MARAADKQAFVAEGRKRVEAAIAAVDYPDVPKYRISAAVDALLDLIAEIAGLVDTPPESGAGDAGAVSVAESSPSPAAGAPKKKAAASAKGA
jgi:hypothetical protein